MIPILETKSDQNKFLKQLEVRGEMDTGRYIDVVKMIIGDVRRDGDEAVVNYTNQFDQVDITVEDLRVSKEEMKAAFEGLDEALKASLILAKERIEAFHLKQKRESWLDIKESGEVLGQRIMPLETAGVYVPGGKAAYPSSVLMNVIPAKVAGVKKIVMVSPLSRVMSTQASIPQNVLAAAYIAGVDEFYTIGGAQAIAALAFGTKTIPKVDKIVGPGNIYVALAKKEVYGHVSIDSIAGPSEILILADETANPTYVAADMLSQAEHDELASAVVVTTDLEIANAVQQEAMRLYSKLERQHILNESLSNYSAIIVVENFEEAAEISNKIAPEHLEIATDSPLEKLQSIKNAGAIFLGHYTPEPLGDYVAGPNHVLPTNSTARFFSPLGVDDFIKKSSVLYFTPEALEELADATITLAESEKLDAHAMAIKVRRGEV